MAAFAMSGAVYFTPVLLTILGKFALQMYMKQQMGMGGGSSSGGGGASGLMSLAEKFLK